MFYELVYRNLHNSFEARISILQFPQFIYHVVYLYNI